MHIYAYLNFFNYSITTTTTSIAAYHTRSTMPCIILFTMDQVIWCPDPIGTCCARSLDVASLPYDQAKHMRIISGLAGRRCLSKNTQILCLRNMPCW